MATVHSDELWTHTNVIFLTNHLWPTSVQDVSGRVPSQHAGEVGTYLKHSNQLSVKSDALHFLIPMTSCITFLSYYVKSDSRVVKPLGADAHFWLAVSAEKWQIKSYKWYLHIVFIQQVSERDFKLITFWRTLSPHLLPVSSNLYLWSDMKDNLISHNQYWQTQTAYMYKQRCLICVSDFSAFSSQRTWTDAYR